jgi:hypothetical protein
VLTQSVTHGGGGVPGLDLTKVHIMPTVAGARFRGPIPDAPQTLSYFGGTVLKTPHVYVVFWGFGKYGDPAGMQPYLISFLKGVGGSQWEGLLKQYYQIVGGVKQHVQNPANEYKNSWVDNVHAVPAHPSDAQVQAEAQLLSNHFTYNVNDSYVVVTPTGKLRIAVETTPSARAVRMRSANERRSAAASSGDAPSMRSSTGSPTRPSRVRPSSA